MSLLLRDRWPPPEPIAPAGRAAALTVSFCLVLAGVATVVLAWNELTCTVLVEPGPERTAPPSICDVLSGIGGIVSFLGIALVAAGFAVLLSLRGRAVRGDGTDGWRKVLALVFTIGALVLITRFSSQGCPDGGQLDARFHICIDDAAGTRYTSEDRVWMKVVAAVLAPVVAFGLLTRRRLIALGIVATVTVWVVGIGWLLLDTMGRDLQL